MARRIMGVVTNTPSEEGYRVPAVGRAIAILRILAARGSLPLATLVEETGLNKSTTFYILRTLAALDMVDYDEQTKTYSLGIGVLELSSSTHGQFDDIAIAKRYLAELLETLDVSIVLYRRVNPHEIIMVDKLERAHRVRISLQAGARIPIGGGSFGRAFLAFDSDEEVQEVLRDGLHQFTPKSVVDIDAFRRELVKVRAQRWAIDHEGFALGVSTVAAPIFDPDGQIVMVAAAVGFASVLTGKTAVKCGEELRRACDRIGEALSRRGTILHNRSPVAAPRVAVPERATRART
jgi:DNA-binding IclR family transcriptional regulator